MILLHDDYPLPLIELHQLIGLPIIQQGLLTEAGHIKTGVEMVPHDPLQHHIIFGPLSCCLHVADEVGYVDGQFLQSEVLGLVHASLHALVPQLDQRDGQYGQEEEQEVYELVQLRVDELGEGDGQVEREQHPEADHEAGLD